MKIQPIHILFTAAAIGIIWFISKGAEKIGLIDSTADRKKEKNLVYKWLTPEPFLDFQKRTNFVIPDPIKNFVLPNLVQKIYEAKGFFTDDENAIYSFFRDLQSKRQVSLFAYYFKQEKKISLNSFLDSFLNADEIENIIKIIKLKKDDEQGFYK